MLMSVILILEKKDMQSAVEYMNLLDLNELTYDELIHISSLWTRLLDPVKAINTLSKAVEIRPNDKKAHQGLVENYLILEKYDDARDHAQTVAEIDPSAESLYLLGGLFCYYPPYDWELAKRVFIEGIKHYPDDIQLNLGMGQVLSRQLKELKKDSTLLDPELSQSYFNDGLRYLDVVLEKDPTLFEALFEKAELFSVNDQPHMAENIYKKIASSDENGIFSRLSLQRLSSNSSSKKLK
eukprot:TRINITY_DN8640_c0_g2_i1.p1 TRINITY_DN8640_c0_g2~~TRINITY_DN8640_c0_g2_i1.p1  ORF type:complete len:239 (-),score=45.10 TRINITY_DN8640_c0_g2_i1:22-738(-)